MEKMLAVALALVLAVFAAPARAQSPDDYFSADQLDNLVAPIALYPDPLLAQVLVAATFPDQIDEASRFVRDDSNPADIDDQDWDVSVKAVAHYPSVLEMMADKLDWTTSLGQAYVNQSTDVMESVQRLRAEARAEGNLISTPEMEVVDSDGEIELWPAQPEYIYVPEYNPGVVFFRRAPLFFRTRFFIGAWLNIDFDWRGHRVFYHGWEGGRGGWIDRSRFHVRINNVYVNRTYVNVRINRTVINRQVNYGALNRYDDVHRNTTFDNIRRGRAVTPVAPPAVRQPFNNKIIDRNINTRDPRLNEYRGRQAEPALQPRALPEPMPQPRAFPTPAPQPRAFPAPVPQPRPFSAPAPQPHAPPTPAFTPERGGFDPRQASQRGEASRAHAAPPPSRPQPPAQPREEKKKEKH